MTKSILMGWSKVNFQFKFKYFPNPWFIISNSVFKDAALEPDARGSVVIKSSIHYNPIRAALAMFQPGEELLWKEVNNYFLCLFNR